MKKSRFSDSQIMDALKRVDEPPRESWRLFGLSQAPTVEA